MKLLLLACLLLTPMRSATRRQNRSRRITASFFTIQIANAMSKARDSCG
jgi:hypothetical protein